METAQTADYALAILLALGSGGSKTISELTAELDLSRSVGQRIVVTLHQRGFVVRRDDSRYALGPALINLAKRLPHPLATAAQPFLLKLAEYTGEMVVLTAPQGEEGVVVSRHSGSNGSVRIEYEVGFRHPLWKGAGGLSIIANLPEAKRLNFKAVLSEVDAQKILHQGYARTSGQLHRDMEGIAAPITTKREGVVGSIAIAVPTIRTGQLDSWSGPLMAAASAVSVAYEEMIDFAPLVSVGAAR